MSYHVKLREAGGKQHQLLGNERLTRKHVHAITFEDRDKAKEAGAWLAENNPGAFDSVQVADAETGRVVEQVA